jgi:hypothetical protein
MTMAVNLRLTHVVKDRAVQNFQVKGSELLISFVDGSTMIVSEKQTSQNGAGVARNS